MKWALLKFCAWILTGFVTFNIGFIGFAISELVTSVATGEHGSFIPFNDADPVEIPVEVGFCPLVGNPAGFEGRMVRTRVRFKVLNYGWTLFYNENCSATVLTESASGGDTVRRRWPNDDEAYVWVTGRVSTGTTGGGDINWRAIKVEDIDDGSLPYPRTTVGGFTEILPPPDVQPKNLAIASNPSIIEKPKEVRP